MVEQIIITALSTAGALHIMQKWQIKNPLNCDFCFLFWTSFFSFFCSDIFKSDLSVNFTAIYKPFVYALSSAVLGFYVLIRINMYANNR